MATEILLLHGLNSFSDTTNKKAGRLFSFPALFIGDDRLFVFTLPYLIIYYIMYKQERKS